MTLRFLIVLSLIGIGHSLAWAKDHISLLFGKTVETPISREAIDAAPKWADNNSNPPVSARQALATATKKRTAS